MLLLWASDVVVNLSIYAAGLVCWSCLRTRYYILPLHYALIIKAKAEAKHWSYYCRLFVWSLVSQSLGSTAAGTYYKTTSTGMSQVSSLILHLTQWASVSFFFTQKRTEKSSARSVWHVQFELKFGGGESRRQASFFIRSGACFAFPFSVPR